MYVFVQTSTMAADCCGVGQATIDKLTDDALLEIFDFYLKEDQTLMNGIRWCTCAEGGETSCLPHRTASIYDFSAQEIDQ
jgi:hypothetical protein